jgi:hypothetical protein
MGFGNADPRYIVKAPHNVISNADVLSDPRPEWAQQEIITPRPGRRP